MKVNATKSKVEMKLNNKEDMKMKTEKLEQSNNNLLKILKYKEVHDLKKNLDQRLNLIINKSYQFNAYGAIQMLGQ